MQIVGLILARGKSMRDANKNGRQLVGLPLSAYTLRAMKDNNRINRLVVTTNDDDMARVAEKHGVEVPFRRSDAN